MQGAGLIVPVLGSGFLVSGSRVSGLGSRVSVCEFVAVRSAFRVSCFGFRGVGSRVSGFRVSAPCERERERGR